MRILTMKYPFKKLGILCTSDDHIDAIDHDEKLFKNDHDEAARKGYRIYKIGDTFDGIAFRDPRYTQGNDKSEKVDAFIDQYVDLGYEKYKKYADLIDVIGQGNHENTILKYYGSDIIRRLINALNEKRDKSLNPIQHGGYTGFLRVRMRTNKHVAANDWWYHHGCGGSAPVTKGMIDINRVISKWQADVYWMGHKHTKISDDSIRMGRLNKAGTLEIVERLAFFTAGYKGKVIVDDDKNAGRLDWGEQSFYGGLQSQGSRVVIYEPCSGSGRDIYTRELRTMSRKEIL